MALMLLKIVTINFMLIGKKNKTLECFSINVDHWIENGRKWKCSEVVYFSYVAQIAIR